MISTGPNGLRAVRALVFGTSVLLLAATAHLLAGGTLPTLPVLLAVGLPVACASAVLARRTRGLPTLLAALAVGQVVLHETFMSTAGVACAPAHGAGAGAGGSMHHHATSVTCDPMPAMSGAHALPSVLMLALHAVAVVATALLLAHGERLSVRIVTWARDLLAPSRPVVVGVPTRTPVLVRVVGWCAPLRAATDVSRRGPPVRPALSPVTA